MKRNVLDHEISSLLLGELSGEEAADLEERLRDEEGNLDRIDRLKKKDEAFLARFPAKVFAAQVKAGLRKKSYELQTSKHTDKTREGRMIIGKRIVFGAAILTFVGWFANDLHSTFGSEVTIKSQLIDKKQASIVKVLRPKTPVEDFDADFSKLEIRLLQGLSYDETFVVLNAFSKKYESELERDRDRHFWILGKYADLLDSDGKNKDSYGRSFRVTLIQEFQNLSSDEKESLDISKDGIAKTLFLNSEEDFLTMTSIVLSSSDEETLKRNLTEKQTLVNTISKKLDIVIALDIPRWTVAAHYRIASTYIDSADSIRGSSLPPLLSAKRVLKYTDHLENRAMKIELNAVESLQKGLAFPGVRSQYLGESRILLERLKAKICPSENEMEALHSTIWEVEHGSLNFAKKVVGKIGKRSEIHFPDVREFKTKVMGETTQIELIPVAESLRQKMEHNWVCLPSGLHEQFHKRIKEEIKVRRETEVESKSDKELIREALDLMVSAKFSEAIERCAPVTKGCERVLAVSYKRTGDATNACKYMRLAGMKSMGGLKCGAEKSIIEEPSQRLSKKTKSSGNGSVFGVVRKRIGASGKQQLSRADVTSTVRKYGGRINYCAKTSNKQAKKGSVKVSFLIKPNGRVTSPRLQGSFKGTDVGRCVRKVVAGMKFPKTDAAKNRRISYPFTIR